MDIAESSNVAPVWTQDNPNAIASDLSTPQAEVIQQDDIMALDAEPVVVENSLSVPCFLKRVMEAEKGEAEGRLGRLVITVHAVFLESGFVVRDGGSRLPRGRPSEAASFSVQYTLPELVGAVDRRDVKVAMLRFSMMGNYATVNGFLTGDHQDVYRVCIDLSNPAPLLSLSMDSLSEQDEKEIFGLWKVAKDELTLPLLIDICHENELPPPACFMRLPAELQLQILELVSAIDLAKIACTCSELRFLSSDDHLWMLRFLEEFGSVKERLLVGGSWKDTYVNYRTRMMEAERMRDRFGRPSYTTGRFNPYVPQRFPALGGYYDGFPATAGFAPPVLRLGFNPVGRLRYPVLGRDYGGFPAIGGSPSLPYRRNFH